MNHHRGRLALNTTCSFLFTRLTVFLEYIKTLNRIPIYICSAYRTDDAKPIVLPVVRAVEAQMAADQTLNKEYLPVPGLPDYRSAATKLLLGADSSAIAENRVRLQVF